MNRHKDRIGIVYSTATDFAYNTQQQEEPDTLPLTQQCLRVRVEKKGRGGKTVTIVSGFVGRQTDLLELGKLLKSRCGVGGAVKDGEILIQGELRTRVLELLKSLGYTQTK